jgi:hypothetical protein
VKYGYCDATGEREAELIGPLLTPSHGDKVKPEKKKVNVGTQLSSVRLVSAQHGPLSLASALAFLLLGLG